jgi:hypothetical protein
MTTSSKAKKLLCTCEKCSSTSSVDDSGQTVYGRLLHPDTVRRHIIEAAAHRPSLCSDAFSSTKTAKKVRIYIAVAEWLLMLQ